LRSADQKADAGVLPNDTERATSQTCVLALPGALHNDMHDGGPAELRRSIAATVVAFLQGAGCAVR
jgi:hypothetical protein